MTFVKLNEEQMNGLNEFKKEYIKAENAATGSKFDANANVQSKNAATLASEFYKGFNVQMNRKQLYDRISELYGKEQADKYLEQLANHVIYKHDESAFPFLMPYCVSMNLFPFLKDGMKGIGGESDGPKHLKSFCGNFVNLIYSVSAFFAGAIATVEFLMYFDYFAKKDYGEDYTKRYKDGDEFVKHEIDNWFQHVVYGINMPATARNFQSVFWNISLYDEPYFNSLFGNFCFPDEKFTKPTYESVKEIQNIFMKWFNKERTKKVLTFPVVTSAMLTDENGPIDKEFAKDRAKDLADGNSFFTYMSDSPDSLASCCRLRNEISDNTFSYSLGAGGVSTGSVSVITINMNRLEQQKKYSLEELVEDIHKYQIAFMKEIEDMVKDKMLPVYDAGFISLKKQFLTIGINGMAEAAEFNGLTVGNNDEFKKFVGEKLQVIFDLNKKVKAETGYMFNTEFVPAENLGVKNAKWDRENGLFVPRDCYNSYFYLVEDDVNTNVLDKFILHGKEINQYLDGGSALHLNLEEYLSEEQFYQLFVISAKTGCNYFCTNVKVTICNECEHIDKRTRQACTKCGSTNIDYGTRIIGYLKRISSFSKPRQKEAAIRAYHKDC